MLRCIFGVEPIPVVEHAVRASWKSSAVAFSPPSRSESDCSLPSSEFSSFSSEGSGTEEEEGQQEFVGVKQKGRRGAGDFRSKAQQDHGLHGGLLPSDPNRPFTNEKGGGKQRPSPDVQFARTT